MPSDTTDTAATKAAPPRRNLAERGIERLIFASRWLLAPFYLGLVVALGMLLVKFVQELVHFVLHGFTGSEADAIVGVLTLVDLCFTGSLVVIVIFSGYENFVSRIETDGTEDWPEWMSKIDFTGLKLKLMSSIVAISAIQLLKIFMDLKSTTDREVMWYVGLHLVFVISGLVFALTDRIGDGGHAPARPDPHA